MNEQEFYKYDEIKIYFQDYLRDNLEYDQTNDKYWRDDLHNNAFNTDYYIIGTYQAKQWLGSKAFDIIGIVKDYEIDNFGEVTTDLSDAEKVVNMYAYIVGEYIVNDYLETSEEKQKIAV